MTRPALPKKEPLELVGNWRKRSKSISKYQFIHHFFPTHHARATLFSVPALVVYSLIMFFVFSIVFFVPKLLPGVLGYASDIRVDALLKDTNKARAAVGLPALKINPKLSQAAYDKAKYMFAKDFWAHTAPDGTQPWDFILKYKYDYAYAGENLAKNFNESQEVVDAWYQSPSHRENLLNKNYDDIGFAVVDGVLNGYETTLVVQMFGRLRGAPAPLADSEPTPQPVPAVEILPTAYAHVAQVPQVFGAYDISKLQKYSGVTFLSFLLLLLGLDIWYSRRNGILKVTGHSFAHFMFLLFVLVGVWFVLTPGKVL